MDSKQDTSFLNVKPIPTKNWNGMRLFKSYIKEKFQIPPKELDDLLYKTQVIVNNDVKKNLKVERDIQQGNLHLEILRLLNLEWNEKRVELDFVFRVTDKIFKLHSNQ